MIRRLSEPSSPSQNIISKHARRSERGKKGWFEKEETIVFGKGKGNVWSQNSQPMHDAKSPGPIAIQLVLCNREWAFVVSAICDELQRGTHVDGKAMQPTTSPTNHLQPQHTPLVMHVLSYTSIYTHTMVHSHMV